MPFEAEAARDVWTLTGGKYREPVLLAAVTPDPGAVGASGVVFSPGLKCTGPLEQQFKTSDTRLCVFNTGAEGVTRLTMPW